MRCVVARKEHFCTRCHEAINEGQVCYQSLSFYGRFFHLECCTPHGFLEMPRTAEAFLKESEEVQES